LKQRGKIKKIKKFFENLKEHLVVGMFQNKISFLLSKEDIEKGE